MKENKYLTYGMITGLLVGTVISVITHFNIGFCIGAPMMLGIVIGTVIDEEKKKKSDN